MKSCLFIFILYLIQSVTLSASPYSLVDEGNSYLKKKKIREAEASYKKAESQKPETPEIIFNLGNLNYHKKDYDKAIEYFTKASVKGDKKIEIESMFRIGNSYFKKAENLMDAEIQESIENFKKAISFYQDLLKIEPDQNDAKINIQRARLIIKDLLDKLKKQQEEQKKQGNKDQQNKNNQKQDDKNKDNKQEKQNDKKDDQNKNKDQNKDKKQGQKPEPKTNPKKLNPEQAMKQLKKLQEEDKKKMKKYEDMQINGAMNRGEEWW